MTKQSRLHSYLRINSTNLLTISFTCATFYNGVEVLIAISNLRPENYHCMNWCGSWLVHACLTSNVLSISKTGKYICTYIDCQRSLESNIYRN